MIALVDCDKMYASCERIMRPDLVGKPVVVLSNNDGCLITVSAEAKALGFKMGDAFFEVRSKLQEYGVTVFSSNYALYGDISNRVMSVLREFTPDIEVYSIDEAFLDLSGFSDLQNYGRRIRSTVGQWTGMPVCVGMAPTKTLAKLANRIAKKTPEKRGVFVLPKPLPEVLQKVEVGDVWGIGRQLSKRFESQGLFTAYDLSLLDARQVRQQFNVVVERTVRELQGFSCIQFDEAPPHPQHIMVSRGFRNKVVSARQLSQAVGLYASRAGEKARKKGVFASSLTVFIKTSPFSKGPRYQSSTTISFNEARNDTPALVRAGNQALRKIFKPGFEYQKAGIMLTGLVYADERQPSFFGGEQPDRKIELMKAMDKINAAYGRDKLRVASSGYDRPWFMARKMLSPKYTTSWDDLRQVTV